ncbi:PREDICTED: uncharacterized protein LOC105365313 [Ceratosolen solmsi marchali]|uniref:Uncharacterized protein LOC105365313 n=1 Tax=Ceratosolen solmsi marchali TaxID=326594 RepID=A0AAJ7DZ55_9HYME|nr:PREDICTED: uncharacterized protein LOC105365313 [Ceratosolen solmsi marchali]
MRYEQIQYFRIYLLNNGIFKGMGYGLPGESVLRLSTECAETAYSPPATRRHLSIQDPLNLKLSPSLGKICEPSMADNSSMMAVSEPILEATLPNVSSSMEPLLKNIGTPALPLETSAAET